MVLDEKHLAIQAPKNSGSAFFNDKSLHSIPTSNLNAILENLSIASQRKYLTTRYQEPDEQ